MVTFTPAGGGNAIAVKVGTAKAAGLSSLTGKTVAISKPSLLAGTGMGNNWLMMQPVTAGAAKTGASSVSLLKLEGARQGAQAAALTGQNFTVVKPMMAGKTTTSTLFLQPAGGGDIVALKMANTTPALSGLVGKTVTVAQPPMVAGGQTSAWLALKPATAATTGKVVGGATVAAGPAFTPVAMTNNGGAVAMTANLETPAMRAGVEIENEGAAKAATAKGGTVKAGAGKAGMGKTGMGKAGAGKAGAGKTGAAIDPATTKVVAAKLGTGGATGVNAAAVTTATGSSTASTTAATIWNGKGLSLGLGLGLGAWGPAIIGAIGVSAAYGYWRSKQEEPEAEL